MSFRCNFFCGLMSLVCYHVMAENTMEMTYRSYIGDKIYDTTLTTSQSQVMPLWHENEPYPPLSPRKAVTNARTHFARVVNDANKWDVGQIALVPVYLFDSTKWLYVVRFDEPIPPQGMGSGKLDTFDIYVLMDGTVLEPRLIITEPKARKDR